MTPEKWLAEQIKKKGIKQRHIAEHSGIPDFNAQKLSLSLTGYRKIQVDEFLACCAVIGVNPMDYPLTQAKGDEADA